MKDGRSYTYTVLRYVHDVVTGEFVNVGVILHVPALGLLDVRVRTSMGRLRGVFPDLDREAFSRTMRAVERSVRKLATSLKHEGMLKSDGDAVAMANRALPRDDSSLQWSAPAGSGLTNDATKTMDRLFDRFVAKYDTRSHRRRTDDDVWRPVRQRLEERNLGSVLHEKTLVGGVDEIVFKHAWKNGVWHVYEPLSFDLADAEHIKTKAREWAGHILAVADAPEQFRLHFIVASPGRPELRSAYASALAILGKAPVQPEILDASNVDDIVDRIEDEVRAHDAGVHV